MPAPEIKWFEEHLRGNLEGILKIRSEGYRFAWDLLLSIAKIALIASSYQRDRL